MTGRPQGRCLPLPSSIHPRASSGSHTTDYAHLNLLFLFSPHPALPSLHSLKWRARAHWSYWMCPPCQGNPPHRFHKMDERSSKMRKWKRRLKIMISSSATRKPRAYYCVYCLYSSTPTKVLFHFIHVTLLLFTPYSSSSTCMCIYLYLAEFSCD